MIVVADTSPINYLVLIEEIDVLTKMYGAVVIPRMVRDFSDHRDLRSFGRGSANRPIGLKYARP
jgi:predicted nucleic acid-binding protein